MSWLPITGTAKPEGCLLCTDGYPISWGTGTVWHRDRAIRTGSDSGVAIAAERANLFDRQVEFDEEPPRLDTFEVMKRVRLDHHRFA